jgi:hypothetical protein
MEVHGERQGRGWWLQGTFGVSSKATKLVGQAKFSAKAKPWFSCMKYRALNPHRAITLAISQVALVEITSFSFRRTALALADQPQPQPGIFATFDASKVGPRQGEYRFFDTILIFREGPQICHRDNVKMCAVRRACPRPLAYSTQKIDFSCSEGLHV